MPVVDVVRRWAVVRAAGAWLSCESDFERAVVRLLVVGGLTCSLVSGDSDISFMKNDSLLNDGCATSGGGIALHSRKKRTAPFPDKWERRQSLVGAVPGLFQSALSGMMAMVNRS